jgi:hypothetical protein
LESVCRGNSTEGSNPSLSAKKESTVRRGARAVEWGGLENRWPGNRSVGSNPTLSAMLSRILDTVRLDGPVICGLAYEVRSLARPALDSSGWRTMTASKREKAANS